jgi:hypothetical protein
MRIKNSVATGRRKYILVHLRVLIKRNFNTFFYHK